MAFEEYKVKAASQRSAILESCVSIGVVGQKTRYISIAVGGEVLETVGWKIGDKVALYFGTGEDKGKALLKKSPEGSALTQYYKKSDRKTALLMRVVKPVKPIEDFVDRVVARENVAHEWDPASGGLLVTLPAAFFFRGETNLQAVPDKVGADSEQAVPHQS